MGACSSSPALVDGGGARTGSASGSGPATEGAPTVPATKRVSSASDLIRVASSDFLQIYRDMSNVSTACSSADMFSDKYERSKVIVGKGGSSLVYRGTALATGEQVAVKLIAKRSESRFTR